MLLASASLQAAAQQTRSFDMVQSHNKEEVIYRGQVSFNDLAGVKAFDLEHAAAQYRPAPEAIKALSEQLSACRLLVFLGTWCEDSHRMIPQLYRVLGDVHYPPEKITLYAVDREKKAGNGEEQVYHITNVPTVIVLRNGTEAGRITEIVDQSVEADLLKILGK